MPCPFGDEWWVITDIARGRNPLSLSWLWSQHNEHRIAIARILIWIDLFRFGGTNKSLFVEIFLVQILHLAVIAWAIEKWTGLDRPVRRTIQGLFAFCLFHPNQHENFTWAFQISFVMPFAITTTSFLLIAFYEEVRGMGRRGVTGAVIALAPFIAALNMAGALAAGPVLLVTGVAKRLRPWLLVGVVIVFTISGGLYLVGHAPIDASHPPGRAIYDSRGIWLYMLTYFGASWTKLLPHKERIVAFVSFAAYFAFVGRALRRRESISNLEWFCLSECTFVLGVAFVTALGRIHLGPGQAFASRYQTAAMIYWASLCTLCMLYAVRRWPERFPLVQGALALVFLLSTLTWGSTWRAAVSRGVELRTACTAVMAGSASDLEIKTLHIDAGLEPGATFLRKQQKAPFPTP
ncbi:MAG: hypothetical protein WBW33_24035 [Bryobacteraceae bacterium]